MRDCGKGSPMTQLSQLPESLVSKKVITFIFGTVAEKRRDVADVRDHCMH